MQAILTAILTLLGGGIAGALITAGFNYAAHQNDLDTKMIELSIGILRAEPTPELAPCVSGRSM
jgi:hypothetical protein